MSDNKIIDACCTKKEVIIAAENMPPLIVFIDNGKYRARILKIVPLEDVDIEEQL